MSIATPGRGIRSTVWPIVLTLLLVTGPARADLRDVLSSIVMVAAEVPGDARTAEALGTERVGSGVVIDGTGLVVTAGYLVLEASRTWIQTGGQQRSRADVVAYDSHSGFALLRARDSLDEVVPMALGSSADLEARAPAVVASFGGPASVRPLLTAARRDFAGYWEYLLEDAIITSPFYQLYGGAALMSPRGELLGVGSLALGDVGDGTPGNLFIPVDLLKATLGNLLAGGRRGGPARPWLGLFADDENGEIVVRETAAEGPARAAGIVPGDIVIGVDGSGVENLAGFYRALWRDRSPGDEVTLSILRDEDPREVAVTSADRYDWLRIER